MENVQYNMPRRSDRTGLDMSANPFEGESAKGAYERLRWGRQPGQVWKINAPEPLFTIGNIAKLYLTDGYVWQWKDNGKSPFLAVGLKTNYLYIVPQNQDGTPINVPNDWSVALSTVKVMRTDYYSDKNDGDAYYYHEHERPYPQLVEHPNGCGILYPGKVKNGRSYIVDDDGIIG